jgi:hypothetical protein
MIQYDVRVQSLGVMMDTARRAQVSLPESGDPSSMLPNDIVFTWRPAQFIDCLLCESHDHQAMWDAFDSIIRRPVIRLWYYQHKGPKASWATKCRGTTCRELAPTLFGVSMGLKMLEVISAPGSPIFLPNVSSTMPRLVAYKRSNNGICSS